MRESDLTSALIPPTLSTPRCLHEVLNKTRMTKLTKAQLNNSKSKANNIIIRIMNTKFRMLNMDIKKLINCNSGYIQCVIDPGIYFYMFKKIIDFHTFCNDYKDSTLIKAIF